MKKYYLFFLLIFCISCNHDKQTDTTTSDSTKIMNPTKKANNIDSLAAPSTVTAGLIRMITLFKGDIPNGAGKTYSFEPVKAPNSTPGAKFSTLSTTDQISSGDIRNTFGRSGYVPLCPLPECAFPNLYLPLNIHGISTANIISASNDYDQYVNIHPEAQLKKITISISGLQAYANDTHHQCDTIALIPVLIPTTTNIDVVVVRKLGAVGVDAAYLTQISSLIFSGTQPVCTYTVCRP